MKSGPIYLGDIGDNEDWWGVAKPAIEAVRTALRPKQRLRLKYCWLFVVYVPTSSQSYLHD